MNVASALAVSEAIAAVMQAVRPSYHPRRLKRHGYVYTEVVPAVRQLLCRLFIIHGRVFVKAVINADGWRGYDGRVDVGYAKHFRVNYGANEFARGAITSTASGFLEFYQAQTVKVQESQHTPSTCT